VSASSEADRTPIRIAHGQQINPSSASSEADRTLLRSAQESQINHGDHNKLVTYSLVLSPLSSSLSTSPNYVFTPPSGVHKTIHPILSITKDQSVSACLYKEEDKTIEPRMNDEGQVNEDLHKNHYRHLSMCSSKTSATITGREIQTLVVEKK
jgi:hypothetical protein